MAFQSEFAQNAIKHYPKTCRVCYNTFIGYIVPEGGAGQSSARSFLYGISDIKKYNKKV